MKEMFLAAYNDHSDALFRYCLFKVGDREIAKDLIQEVFVKTWVYIEKGNEITNFKPFLYKTLRNLIIDYYRKHKTSSLDTLQENGFDRALEEPISIEDKFDGEKALEFFSKLSSDYKEVLYMKYVEGLDLLEIAEITGELENTVSVRMHRGLKKLKEFFPENI